MTTTPEKKSTKKTTPRERAQAQVDLLKRKRDRAVAKRDEAQDVLTAANAEITQVERQLDYAERNPDLEEAPAAAGTPTLVADPS